MSDTWTLVLFAIAYTVIASVAVCSVIAWRGNRDIDNMHRSQGPWHDPASCDWCQKRGLA